MQQLPLKLNAVSVTGKGRLTVYFAWMEQMTVCIVMEVVGTTVFSVLMEKMIAGCAWMVFAIPAVELEENGKPVGVVMEMAYVTIAMGGVVQHATIQEFAVIVTELVKNGVTAGYVTELVNAPTVTDKDGKRAPTVTVKAEKHAMNVMETA